ncbi:trypsin-like cysteine/serine peptidase domain-containing protein [Gaertneriomyces semiglobifer]|nr:trypsin-like cysteine/serine peptidase domain-containing protein [Gaertneriomyces semiglobifer]
MKRRESDTITTPTEPIVGFPSSSQPIWQKTVEQAVKAIVSIRFSQVAAFDTEGPETSEASGFVVDATRGLILTNRHVACAGPFVGEAVFHDHEEVDVYPVYRDPIHDFGVLKFDPTKIKYMPVTEIELAPHLAQVGLDIRVVGNDAGEKLSILAGSISRLDRNAPEYGEMTYNDFNTFYLQAASSTSGGSSGSPVLNVEGKAVALQAGGRVHAATDFFFPLDRVARALEFIKKGESVPRGTVQTQWTHRPFDEVRRLGLTDDVEAKVRKMFPSEVGMLVVEVVVPKGPASGLLEEGDVLLTINGTWVTKFVPLEDMLDNSIGRTIKVVVQRGGVEVAIEIPVQDLHSITPDRYVEAGGSKLNNLSYQLARQFAIPVEGVWVAEPSGMFRLDGPDRGWIITSLDTKPTPSLDAFIEAFRAIPDRERVPVEFYSILDVHTKNLAVVVAERHWSGFRLAVRNDTTGKWDFENLGPAPPPKPLPILSASFADLDESLGNAKEIFRCLVKVMMYLPVKIEGFPKSRKLGAGLILDAARGLVIVGRNIVPYALGDIFLTFADSIIIPAKPLFLHPTHNFAIIQYDPVLIGSTPVMSAPISDEKLGQGRKTTLVALNAMQRPVVVETRVTDITAVTIPYSSNPRFRAINLDAVTVDTPIAQQCSAGVLCDSQARVQGLWFSYLGERTENGRDNEYHLGIGVECVVPVLEALKEGRRVMLRGLAVEVCPIQMSSARHMGLSEEWVRKVEEANRERRQVFMVKRIENGSRTGKGLRDLDVILAIGDKVITRVGELELSELWEERVTVTVLRQKQVLDVVVETDGFEEGTRRVVGWAGCVVVEPGRAVRQQYKSTRGGTNIESDPMAMTGSASTPNSTMMTTLPSLIYITSRSRGSPSYQYGLVPTMFITHINSVRVNTLDDFLVEVEKIADGTWVRVGWETFDGVKGVGSLKVGLGWWGTWELTRDESEESGWRKRVLQ